MDPIQNPPDPSPPSISSAGDVQTATTGGPHHFPPKSTNDIQPIFVTAEGVGSKPPTNPIQWVAPSRRQQQGLEAYKMEEEEQAIASKASSKPLRKEERMSCKGAAHGGL
ncbi:hypothetical protein ACLOJK_013731 [Asimina triloba]